jgi:hypothetical protein
METSESKKESLRRFLFYFCSWNLLLDLAGVAVLIWFATFIEDTERVMSHYFLVAVISIVSIVRIVICLGILIAKMIKRKWLQAFILFSGFIAQLFITVCFCGILILYIFTASTIAIGPLH